MFIGAIPVSASEMNDYKQAKFNQNKIEEITGLNDLVSGTYKSSKYEAIADGTNTIVKIPKKSSDKIIVEHSYEDSKTFSIDMPNNITNKGKTSISKNGTVVYQDEDSSVDLAAQAINDGNMEGVRSLITIKDKTAPRKYDYNINLSEGSRLVTAADYLGKEFDTKEVYIVDKDNMIIGIIDQPWAKDANGKNIDTHYEVSGNTLTQVVDFSEDSVFPIIADPSAWQITKCAGAISWAVGSTVFAGTKLLKVKKYIKALGGIRTTAKLLIGATTTAEKFKAGGSALVNLASIIFGIDSIKNNCSF